MHKSFDISSKKYMYIILMIYVTNLNVSFSSKPTLKVLIKFDTYIENNSFEIRAPFLIIDYISKGREI